MTKLVCPDCRHENEPERIYCHNCGAKLERSALIKDKKSAEEESVRARAHLQKMLQPGRGRWKHQVLEFLKVLVGAACFAAVIQMLRPPELPSAQPNEISFAPMINMDLATALESHQPPQLVYSEEQVNNYLAGKLRRSNNPAKEGLFPLLRMVVGFEEGSCKINIERQFLGVSIYGSTLCRVTVAGGKIASENMGGHIGHMPIHPALMKSAETLLFSKAWEAFAQERKDVAKLAGIEFHPHSVRLLIAP